MLYDFTKGKRVKLKTFLGTLFPKEEIDNVNNYWKLIGEKAHVIDHDTTGVFRDKVLLLFDKNLDVFELANHNPIENTLWINKSDLELDDEEK